MCMKNRVGGEVEVRGVRAPGPMGFSGSCVEEAGQVGPVQRRGGMGGGAPIETGSVKGAVWLRSGASVDVILTPDPISGTSGGK